MMPFPHRYTVKLSDGHLRASPRDPIAVGPPPQFDGSDRVWSPEDLLVGATLECLWTTFAAMARRSNLLVTGFTGTGVATLDRGKPVPVFTSIALSVDVQVEPGDEARAREILDKAENNCIISNALDVPVTVDARVIAATDHQVAAS